MPGLNEAAMAVAAAALQDALLYAQLHSATAGNAGTSHVTTAGRQLVSWGSITEKGDFGLASQIDFTGGVANGPVYSVTLWSASTNGTWYGEFILSGAAAFNSDGQYTIMNLNLDGSAS